MAKEIKCGQRFYNAILNRYFWFEKRRESWAWDNGNCVTVYRYYFRDAVGIMIEVSEERLGDFVRK